LGLLDKKPTYRNGWQGIGHTLKACDDGARTGNGDNPNPSLPRELQQKIPRVVDQGRACIADQSNIAALTHTLNQNRAYPLFIVLMNAHQLTASMVDVLQQHPRSSGILCRYNAYVIKRINASTTDIAKVSNWSSDHIESS
jgi:hypothetical protein